MDEALVLLFRAMAANQIAMYRRSKTVLALDKPAGRWADGQRLQTSRKSAVGTCQA